MSKLYVVYQKYIVIKPQHTLLPLSFILIILLIEGCRLNPADGLGWDTELAVPIAHTDIRIDNIIQDSSLVSTQDNSLSLVYREMIAEAEIGSLIEFPDTSFTVSVKLDTVSLDSDTISQIITLGELARQLAADGNILGQIILNNHNNTLPFVPATPGLSSGVIEIDASSFFEFAKLKKGELVLTIDNQFPVDLENVQLEVRNANLPGPPIVMDQFSVIPSKTDTTEIYDLSGQEVESQLEGELTNMDIASGTNVPIDTNDFIRVTLVAQKLTATSAKAVFPSQTLIDTLRMQEYEFRGEFADIQLTKAVVKAGKIRAEAISTVEDTIQFGYFLASAVNDFGEIPGVKLKIVPATSGSVATLLEEVPLDGFTLDLTAKGTTFNTFLDSLQVNLIESGKLVNLDDQDSVMVSFGLLDIVPTYVEGYIGQQKFQFEGTAALDIFREFQYQNLRFASPSTRLTFANSIGVPTQIEIRKLTGSNRETGQTMELVGQNMLAGPVAIGHPTLQDTSEVVRTELSFDTDNSNIGNFVNTLLDKVQYDIEVQTNPQAFTGFRDNFGTDKSSLKAWVDFELPLEGSFERFILADTAELTPGQTAPEEITDGILRLVLDNQFPFQGKVSLVIYNPAWREIAVLANQHIMEAGIVGADGYVNQTGRTVIEKAFDKDLIEEILNSGTHMVLRFELDTKPSGTNVRLFSDYKINASLVAQFAVGVGG